MRCSASRSTPGSTARPAGPRQTCSSRNARGCTRCPSAPHTVALGVTRTVAATTPMVTFDGGQYSVPHGLLGRAVWVRVHGQGGDERVVIVHVSAAGPVEVARHLRAQPGSPRLDEAHFPAAPAGALARQPKARNDAESRVPGARRRRPALADRGRRRRQHQDARQDGRCGRAGQARRPRRRSTGHSGTPRSTAASPRPTSARSWPTTPRPVTQPGPSALPARTAA